VNVSRPLLVVAGSDGTLYVLSADAVNRLEAGEGTS